MSFIGRRSAYRPSPVFLALVAAWIAGGAMAWYEFGNATVNVLLFVVAGWVVSLSLHEFSHALFAYRSGDRSVAGRGYLTLNPLKYTHPLLSIGLPILFLLLGGIGLPGGAVWVDRHAINGRGKNSLISLAGPAANIVFLLLLTIPFAIGVDVYPHLTFWASVAFLAFLQLTAAVLNLLPVPGLDGGNAVRPWLSGDVAKLFDYITPFGLLILFALFYTPLGGIFFAVVRFLSDAIGVPRDLASTGYDLLRFWD
ncbi:MAG TPA: site-2 protease family protein [Micromonosporaceae bacterium]